MSNGNCDWNSAALRCLPWKAVGHPLRQLDYSHRLAGEGLGIIDHEIAAVGALVVHKEHQVPIVLACTALCRSGADRAQSELAASQSSELRAGLWLTQQAHLRCRTIVCQLCAKSLTHWHPLLVFQCGAPNVWLPCCILPCPGGNVHVLWSLNASPSSECQASTRQA